MWLVVTLMVMVLQVYSKAVRKGFEFSLMVVGESGLGKSTLVLTIPVVFFSYQ